ncbi:MAG TPA: transcriptional regulator [Acidimicrobiales bacterium]|nr:transcriptional regulator [Acidimicrobiales bacterium]
MSDDTPTSYAQRVGERLRNVRRQQHLSLQAVEAASHHEFKASVLGAYERGERAISVPRLQRLARFYNVPVDQLLPRDLGPEPDWAAAGADVIDLRSSEQGEAPVTIDLTRLDADSSQEHELLGRYLSTIQLQRQDFNGRMLTIRREDLRAIACLFDTAPEQVGRRLRDMNLRR